MKCYGCGTEKDLSKEEVYPYPEDDSLTTDPIPPLMVLDCSYRKQGSRAVIVCFECFHKLQPDIWISEECWNSLNPVIKLDDLPQLLASRDDGMWDVEKYPELVK